ncbi:MAG: hypothetical protein PHR56_09320, partial [Dehalococcoidales bacterium]|nr:hypothetical protein [Dehalococcoidales bacterium]
MQPGASAEEVIRTYEQTNKTTLPESVKKALREEVVNLDWALNGLNDPFSLLRVQKLYVDHLAKSGQMPMEFYRRLLGEGGEKIDLESSESLVRMQGVDLRFSDGTKVKADITLDREQLGELSRQLFMQARMGGAFAGEVFDAEALAQRLLQVTQLPQAATDKEKQAQQDLALSVAQELIRGKVEEDTFERLQEVSGRSRAEIEDALQIVDPYRGGNFDVDKLAQRLLKVAQLPQPASDTVRQEQQDLARRAAQELISNGRVSEETFGKLQQVSGRTAETIEDVLKIVDPSGGVRVFGNDLALSDAGKQLLGGVVDAHLRAVSENATKASAPDATRTQREFFDANAELHRSVLEGRSSGWLGVLEARIREAGTRVIDEVYGSEVSQAMRRTFGFGNFRELVRLVHADEAGEYSPLGFLEGLKVVQFYREWRSAQTDRNFLQESFERNPLAGIPDLQTARNFGLRNAPEKEIGKLLNSDAEIVRIRLGSGRSAYIRTSDYRQERGLSILSTRPFSDAETALRELQGQGRTVITSGNTQVTLYAKDKDAMTYLRMRQGLNDFESLSEPVKRALWVKQAGGALRLNIGKAVQILKAEQAQATTPEQRASFQRQIDFLKTFKAEFNSFNARQYRGFDGSLKEKFREARDEVRQGLADDDPATSARATARVLKIAMERINESHSDFSQKKNNERVQMVFALLGDNSVGLQASGGKTLNSGIELIARAMLFGDVNQILVVRTGEADTKVNNSELRELLACFGMTMVNGNQGLALSTQTTDLKADLVDPAKIVVFDHTNFGHLRNRNTTDPDLVRSVRDQDIIRVDEIHLPLSDRSSFIIGGGKVSVIEQLSAILGKNGKNMPEEQIKPLLERVRTTADVIPILESGRDRATRQSVLDMDTPAGYRNSRTGEFGLNDAAMKKLAEARLGGNAEYLVRAYLEAKNSRAGKEFNVSEADKVIYPVEGGVEQRDRVISDPAYLAFLALCYSSIPLKEVTTTKTLNQATLSEVLRFKPGASVLGFTGTPEGVATLLRMQLGKGVDIISNTDFNAQIIKVEAGARIETIAQAALENSRSGKGML